jgi:hypothetical protein
VPKDFDTFDFTAVPSLTRDLHFSGRIDRQVAEPRAGE